MGNQIRLYKEIMSTTETIKEPGVGASKCWRGPDKYAKASQTHYAPAAVCRKAESVMPSLPGQFAGGEPKAAEGKRGWEWWVLGVQPHTQLALAPGCSSDGPSSDRAGPPVSTGQGEGILQLGCHD